MEGVKMAEFLSQLSPEKEKKQFGFTVYDAETGMPMPYQDLYLMDTEGRFCVLSYGEVKGIPKESKLVIFFSDCSWMRY